MSTTPALPEDQARLLEDALIAVRQQTALMRKCLEAPGKLMDALKCWYVQQPTANSQQPTSPSPASLSIKIDTDMDAGPLASRPVNSTSRRTVKRS